MLEFDCSNCANIDVPTTDTPCDTCNPDIFRGSNWTAIKNKGGDKMDVEVESVRISFNSIDAQKLIQILSRAQSIDTLTTAESNLCVQLMRTLNNTFGW